MKCPVCGVAELIHDTRDITYTYNNETVIIPNVTGDYCHACDESITNSQESERIMNTMNEFKQYITIT